MAITFDIATEGTTLVVTSRGFDENLHDVQAYGQGVFAACLAHECTQALCDERDLEYRLSTLDTFELATSVSQMLPSMAKLAIVPNTRAEPDAKFFETVAVNRALAVKVFREMDEARAWLGLPTLTKRT